MHISQQMLLNHHFCFSFNLLRSLSPKKIEFETRNKLIKWNRKTFIQLNFFDWHSSRKKIAIKIEYSKTEAFFSRTRRAKTQSLALLKQFIFGIERTYGEHTWVALVCLQCSEIEKNCFYTKAVSPQNTHVYVTIYTKIRNDRYIWSRFLPTITSAVMINKDGGRIRWVQRKKMTEEDENISW